MAEMEINIRYEIYDSINQLEASDALLLNKARQATNDAYAPYSKFMVAAAGILTNGEAFTATNQENASYPVGICAERALLSTVSAIHPGIPIVIMAVSYHNLLGDSSKPATPCGMCRQALGEYEYRWKKPIRLVLSGMEGKVYVFEQATLLLPLGFSGTDLK